jgi:hypothetical protein
MSKIAFFTAVADLFDLPDTSDRDLVRAAEQAIFAAHPDLTCFVRRLTSAEDTASEVADSCLVLRGGGVLQRVYGDIGSEIETDSETTPEQIETLVERANAGLLRLRRD